MSQVEIPEEIGHLDFEPERENEYKHHRHPTMPKHRWCGIPAPEQNPFMSVNGKTSSMCDVTCLRCLALIDAFGLPWYWETHRRHYGSNCTTINGVVYHDCGA